MKRTKETSPCPDRVCLEMESLNDQVLAIDLEDLEIEELDQRLELGIAALLDDVNCYNPQCGQFSCMSYSPTP